MMGTILRGKALQCCLVYLDDVTIFTKGNVTRHVVELAAVLERKSRAGLSLKASNCSFGTTRLEYLGHELDSDGIRPMESVVTSVRDFPVPEDEKAVKRFVHLAEFYRRFIVNFGSKAVPLTTPLRKAPFKLVTDASEVGLGAALMQDQDREAQPIAFSSKVNSPTVANWLMKSKDLTGKLHQWALQLQKYGFNVTYQSGSTNVTADALARAPVLQVAPGQANDMDATAEEAAEGRLTDAEIQREQQQDRQVQKLLEAKSQGAVGIAKAGGLVYAITRKGEQRVVLPATLRHKWAQSCRDCGTRKAWAKEIIPPLRSLGLGFVGDRWALDVAGSLPLTARGNRYVIAAVEYATRCAIAVAVPIHTANDVARFLMERVILMRATLHELVMYGAPELNGRAIEEPVPMLQARHVTPLPYRPVLLGLLERFHRSWKDIVSRYVAENQEDWEDWVLSAQYVYNGVRHSTTGTPQLPDNIPLSRVSLLEEIARRETEEYDGDEQEPDVWRHQVARTEVSGGSGSWVEGEDSNAPGVVRSDRQATATRSRPEQTAVGEQPGNPLRAREHRCARAGALLGAWYELGKRPSAKNNLRQEAASMLSRRRNQGTRQQPCNPEENERDARRDQEETPATQADVPVAAERLHSSGVPGTESPGQTSQQVRSDTAGVEEERRAVQVLRGRGRPKKQAATASFADIQVYGTITKRGMRRRSNRAGRYELEYEIEYRTAAAAPVQRKLLVIKEYEVLVDPGELEDELSGDGE
ncbi:unnamed protein product [Phytophthora fragariaefolia]|uniref:Unnamed protein product n=1 Tax=Phytophthora fragariaefolia TaxID=1490495 RepID=A0A9W7D4E3_9STRA|nr:unnamed protein product [Phytophthora fragariaefolia]